MAFDEVLFPERIAVGATGGPVFNTTVIRTAGGRERRQVNWSAPLRRYALSSGFKKPADWQLLLDFYVARDGQARGFRFRDWSDWQVANGVIGTGTGAQTVFPLVKRYASGGVERVRPITKPVAGSVVVTVAGSPSSPAVSTTAGTLTFGVAPASGAEIRASFNFDVPARFASDVMDLVLRSGTIGVWEDVQVEELRA